MWPFRKSTGGNTVAAAPGEPASYRTLEQILEESLAGYRGLLDAIVSYTPRIAYGPPNGDWRKNLRQYKARLEGVPAVATIRETTKAVDRELAGWGKVTEQNIQAQEHETKEAMAALSVMAEVLSQHEKTYGVRFRGISKKLRVLTTSNDIAEIRKKLQGEIELLEKYVDEMAHESESALGRLRNLSERRDARRGGPDPTESISRLAEAVRAHVKTDERVSAILVGVPPEVVTRSGPLIHNRLAEVFESPQLTGNLTHAYFLSVSRLMLPEAAERLEVVERDLSAKLGVRLQTSVFEKSPGQSAGEMLLRAKAKVTA